MLAHSGLRPMCASIRPTQRKKCNRCVGLIVLPMSWPRARPGPLLLLVRRGSGQGGKSDFARVHDLKFQIWIFAGRKSLPRKTDHFRRSINSGDRTLRHGTGQLGGHLAVAATDIENALVAVQVKLCDEFA